MHKCKILPFSHVSFSSSSRIIYPENEISDVYRELAKKVTIFLLYTLFVISY